MKLTGILAEAIKREQEYQEGRRADWIFTKKVMRTILEDLLPEGTKIYCGAGSISIHVKWGVDNLRQARKAMGSGWEFGSNYKSDNGTLTKSYYRYDESVPRDSYRHRSYVSLSLVMDSAELDPNTCKKIEVGEKTYTQKIYQVVCSDGIQEILGKAEELDNEAGYAAVE